MKILLLILPLAIALSSCGDPDTPEQRIAKIKESCEREYGTGFEGKQCQIRLMSQVLAEQAQAREDRAKENSY